MNHTWNVVIQLFNADDVETHSTETAAHAVLTTSDGTSIEGHGRARRNPDDPEIPVIGEELATARALRDLADRLLRVTSEDISEIEHHPVHLRR